MVETVRTRAAQPVDDYSSIASSTSINAKTMLAHEALDHEHSALLSEATLAALNLDRQPFTSRITDVSAHSDDDVNATDAYFSDAITDEQLADIKQALITGDDLLLILGEYGAGKSTLLKQLDANSGLRIKCFPVTGSERFSTLKVFTGMLEAFQQTPSDTLKGVLDALIPCLQGMIARNTLSTIVLDDAHHAQAIELTQLLSAMLYMNSQDETLIRVCLAAPAAFEETIPDLLPQNANLPYSSLMTESYTDARAAAFLQHRLQLAGSDQELPFSESDIASLAEQSGGRPAALQTLSARLLNERHGLMEETLPSELLNYNEGNSFFHTRAGKLAIGGLATLLIVAGLLMFVPSGNNNPPDVAESSDALEPGTPMRTTVTELNLSEPEQSPAAETPAVSAPQQSTVEQVTVQTDSEPDVTSAPQQITIVAPEVADDDSVVSEPPDDALESAESQAAPGSDSAVSSSEDTGPARPVTPAPSPPQTAQPEPEITESVDAEIALLEDAPVDTTDNVVTDVQAPEVEPESVTALSEQPVSVNDQETDSDLLSDLESPSWILVQDEEQYTIQMSASRDFNSIQNFLRRTPLTGPNSIFSFERDGDVWYALVHGVFPTFSAAQRAVEAMPESAQRDQPWIRSIARVKNIMREE